MGDFWRLSSVVCGRKKIAEPCKYYLVCDYFSSAHIFLYFFASHKFGNFVHIPIRGGWFFRDYICSFLCSKYLFDIQVDNRTIKRIERTKENRRHKLP